MTTDHTATETHTCRDCGRAQLAADMSQDGLGIWFCKPCRTDAERAARKIASTSPRWDRLAATLRERGVYVRVTERPWQQVRYGRMEQGVSRSIVVRLPSGGVVEVRDRHGRGGKWYGWTAWLEGDDGLVAVSQRGSSGPGRRT